MKRHFVYQEPFRMNEETFRSPKTTFGSRNALFFGKYDIPKTGKDDCEALYISSGHAVESEVFVMIEGIIAEKGENLHGEKNREQQS